MPRVDLVVESKTSQTPRVRQLEGMFDVPNRTVERVEWHGDVPLDEHPEWNVGLIVGPSGAGKSSIARAMFGDSVDARFSWNAKSVIDDFSARCTMQEISDICQAVGFNTIPAWMRPFNVLSTGERFRVELARRLLEQPDPIVVDEFSSVVDRQVAQIGSHAVQKYIRRANRKFVAVSCHFDIMDWLQPDWILNLPEFRFEWCRGFLQREARRRPSLDVQVSPVPYSAWHTFAPFHYLTASLNKASRSYALFVGARIAAFAGVMYRPVSAKGKHDPVYGLSRVVTLPDWQGLGLAFVLSDALGAAFSALGSKFHTYPAHPSLIRSFDSSKLWTMIKRPGVFSTSNAHVRSIGMMGARPCVVFRYVGPNMSECDAARLLGKASDAP